MRKIICTLLLLGTIGTINAQQVTRYEVRHASNPEDVKNYDTQQIRKNFMIPKIFTADSVNMVYTMYDRMIVGGAMPVHKVLPLETIDPIKQDYFLHRREIGIINVGGKGRIEIDGKAYELDHKDALYIGSGDHTVTFASVDPQSPALFYFNSANAHKTYPTRKISPKDTKVIQAGSVEESNKRTITQYIVNNVVPCCQLQMGLTELAPGSVWNTMPCHTHGRRIEVYFYFNLPKGQAVCHFMGEPKETRCIWLDNNQAVISPEWSIHCGAGTSNYSFIWGMAGENLDYGDMDKFGPLHIR